MSGGQTTWRRIELPGTYRGHALVARFGGEAWTAWEMPDGQWALNYGTIQIKRPQRLYRDWSTARGVAEQARTGWSRVSNPVHPLIAGAAAAGAAAVVKNALLATNPAPTHFVQACSAAAKVANRLPRSWMVGPVQCPSDGSVVAVVRPGFILAAQQRLADLPFRVTVIERTPRPYS